MTVLHPSLARSEPLLCLPRSQTAGKYRLGRKVGSGSFGKWGQGGWEAGAAWPGRWRPQPAPFYPRPTRR